MVRVATTAKFPATALTLADIGLFTNLEDCDLVANITSGAATVDVDDASAFAVGMWLSGRSVDGFEILQVTAVDLALNRVTISRAKDGTVAVAHPQGRTFKAIIPAVALNQLRDDLIAVQTFLGITGACVHWDRGLQLEPSTDTCAILTLNLRSTRTNKKFVSFMVDDVETGAMLYDSVNDAVEFQNIRVDIGTGSDILLEDNRLIRFGTASNAQLAYDSADGRFEWRSDVDTRWQTIAGVEAVTIDPDTALISNVLVRARTDNATDLGSAAVRWRGLYLGPSSLHVLAASGDANDVLHAGSAGFQMGAGGASALDVTLVRQAASIYKVTGNLAGDVRFGMSVAATPFLALRGATADAQPLVALQTDRLAIGAGGAAAADYSLIRTGANTGTLTGTLRPGTTVTYALGSTTEIWVDVFSRAFTVDNAGAGADVVLQANNAAQRANLAGHLSPSATATWDLGESAVRWATGYFDTVNATAITSGHILPAADNTYDLGSASLRWRDVYAAGSSFRVIAALGDANPVARLGSALIAFGAGGASATDVQGARQAASVTEWTGNLAGSVRYGLSGAALPFVELRAAAADANALVRLTSTGVSIGPGGASAVDITFLRTGTNTATITSTSGLTVSGDLLPNADGSRNLGSSALRYTAAAINTLNVFGAASAANPVVHVSSAGVAFGAGGASATDILEARQAASVLQVTGSLAGSVRYGMSGAGTPILQLRAAAADANPVSELVGGGIRMGPGGASAVDVSVFRTGTNIVTINASAGTITSAALGVGGVTPLVKLHVLGTNRNVARFETGGGATQTFVEWVNQTKTWQVGCHDGFGDYTSWGVYNVTDGRRMMDFSAAGLVSFFGAAGAAQAADMGVFTSNGVSANHALVDVATAAVADPSKINANFDDVADGLNDIRTILRGLGVMA